MTDQEHRFTYISAVVLSAVALGAAGVLAYVFHRSTLASVDAFLWMEGTALLASSMQPQRTFPVATLEQSGRLFP
jgi:hypothetical protein